jgi:hypothetical protein
MASADKKYWTGCTRTDPGLSPFLNSSAFQGRGETPQ